MWSIHNAKMVNYTWDFSILWTYRKAIFHGLLTTIELSVLAIIFGTILGIILALLTNSDKKYLRYPSKVFIEFFRDLPLLVLLIWLFYTVTPAFGITLSPFNTAILALTINLGAFSSEIFRSGFNSIHKDQIDSAKVLGLNRFQILKHIIYPQSMKVFMPPLTGRYIETIKLTSLGSYIAVNELLQEGQNIISVTYHPLEIYTAVAVLYLLIILPLSLYLQKLEKINDKVK